MTVKTFLILMTGMLLPIGANAQSYPVPGGNTIVFTGNWPAADLQTVLTAAQQLWPAMQTGAQPTGSQWTVAYQAQTPSSDPCKNTSSLNGQIDVPGVAQQMSLAMFTVCQFSTTDLAGAFTEGQARAKAFLALRALARAGTAGVAPMTSLAAMPGNLSQRYFAAGGSTSFAGNGGSPEAIACVFELFAAKLGGISPTLAPLDAAWAQVTIPASFTGRADQFMPLFLSAADALVGTIAGRNPSTWLQNLPAAFSLDSSQRVALGFPAAGDPTDGVWMQAYWLGAISGWNQSQTVVNPTTALVLLKQSQGGVTSWSGTRTARFRILDAAGATELYASNLEVSSGSGTLSIPPAVVAGLADGAYPAETCVLQDDGASCDPQLDQFQPILIDQSGWTTGKLVVIANGPGYSTLNKAALSLAPGQTYNLTARPGAVAIGGLPASYAEVALSDGAATRKFPWVPDVPGGNIWTWTPFEDPNVLSILDAATFQPSLLGSGYQVSPNTWYALATVGGTPGEPDFTTPGGDGAFPTQACADEYGNTTAVFSSGTQTWNANTNYCSWGQINILAPSTLPAGETVSLQIYRNGTASNVLQTVVSAAEPSIFIADAGLQLGTVVFAVGSQAGSVVAPDLPAHVGDALSVYYTGCGPLSEALPAGQPAPMDHLIYATLPATVTIGDALAQNLFNGLAPGYAGLCQFNIVVPVPVSGTTSPANTIMTSPMVLSVNNQAANELVLPIVFEPNGSYLGNPNATVTVIQYGDYQCPYCEAFFQNTWPQLKAEYVDTGKIRFSFQDYAFLGPDSTTAAMAAHCAGDQYRFWQYHDYLYLHQGGENSGWASVANQKQFAAQLGLNTDQFDQCLDSGKYLQEVQTEIATGRSQGVTAVPTFFVNGTKIVGAQPLADFETVINAALQ